MLKLLVVAASILLVTLTVGCLEQAHQSPTPANTAATSTLKITAPAVVNRNEYATYTCQLNATRGQGLDNKEISWAIDNVNKETSQTVWGFATFNLTMDQTQGLSIGKHVLTASFAGDYDYAASNATTTFLVQTTPSPTPTPRNSTAPADALKASVSLSVPSTASRDAYLTGTYAEMGRNQYLYVLAKPAGNDTWTVQDAPITYLNGTYSVHVHFNSQGNVDLLALITTSTLNPGSTTKVLPKTLAESRVSTTVK
jgi:hypothetical protein